MKFTVDDITACDPVNILLTVLNEKGYVIEKSIVGDYHFNELYFLLSSNKTGNDPGDLHMENIERHSSSTYYCTCHLSIVEIKQVSKS